MLYNKVFYQGQEAALEKLVAQGVIARGSRGAVVSTAHGLKFPDFKMLTF